MTARDWHWLPDDVVDQIAEAADLATRGPRGDGLDWPLVLAALNGNTDREWCRHARDTARILGVIP